MKLRLVKNDRTKTISFSGKTLGELFEKLGYWEEKYVVVKGNKIILKDEKLKNNDKLRIYCTESRG